MSLSTKIVATKAHEGQKPGTSGLRKKASVHENNKNVANRNENKKFRR